MSTFARRRKLLWLPLEKIVPNDRNPRGKRAFSQEQLKDLRRSIEQHGILEPLIVQQYEQDLFLLIEGERRWTVAKALGLKEVPATVVPKLEGDDQVVVMYNLHENRRGWEMADHLRAIQRLMQARPDLKDAELAQELGLSLATFGDRLRVLKMGEPVINDIAQGKVDYTSALRSAQAATAIAKKRPELLLDFGTEKAIQKRLMEKAKARGGISHELTSGKADLTDTEHVPNEVIKEYLMQTGKSLRDVRREHAPAAEKRTQTRNLAKSVLKIEEDLREFQDADFTQAPNLVRLRTALVGLVEVANILERKITEAIISAEATAQTDTREIKQRRKPPAKPAQPAKPKRTRSRKAAADAKVKKDVDKKVEDALEKAGA